MHHEDWSAYIYGAARGGKNFGWGAILAVAMFGALAGVVSYEAIDPGNQAPYDPRTEAPAGVTIDPMDPDYIGYVPNDAVIPTRDGFFVPDPEAHGFKKVSPPTADPDRDGDG